MRTLIALCAVLLTTVVYARDIHIKYRSDPVDVDNGQFQQMPLQPSSLVQQIFYDAGNQYLLVDLNGTFYHYCGIPQHVVSAWVGAPSLGSFYNAQVKGRFDCRTGVVPSYR